MKCILIMILLTNSVISYWIDIVQELTSKLLIDFKCFPIPKVSINEEKEKLEFSRNFLIINHNYNADSNTNSL